MTKRYKKRYRNRADRAMNDMDWEWDNDGYDYIEDVPKRLRRNKIDGVLGGVCAGIGDYTGIDPIIIRIITVITFFATGVPVLLYLALWIFVPKDQRAPYRREYREASLARKASPDRPVRTASFRDVKSKFRSVETRLADLERSITSSEWQLRRDFRDLESK